MPADTTITLDQDDLESLAAAIGLGLSTPQMIANWIGVDLVEECLVLDGSPVYADDGTAEIEYEAGTTPEAAAHAYVDDGDWGETTATKWITVYTFRKGIDNSGSIIKVERESHTITIDPTEPDCINGQAHRWKSPHSLVGGCKENPGVHGHGGGVIITECCTLCGCKKTTDTWAQNPSTGEQGLTSVAYAEVEWANEVNQRHIDRAMRSLGTNSVQTGEFDFEWVDSDGDPVGADWDDLLEYGISLLVEAEPKPLAGTLLSAADVDA